MDGPESREVSTSEVGEDCWAATFSWLREYNLQWSQNMKESQTEEEESRKG